MKTDPPRPSRRLLSLIVVTLCVLASIATVAPNASANHNNTQCDRFEAYISNNNKYFLRYANMNWSHWLIYVDYIAIREDIAGNETFRQLVSPGTGLDVTTTDGLDRYLRTGTQRAGYSSEFAIFSEWSHFYC